MSNKSKHTPGPWRITNCMDDKNGSFYIRGTDESGADMPLAVTRHGPEAENAKLIAAAPDLLKEIEATNAFALELMERAAKTDRLLLEAKGQPLECELGEVVRLRQQLGRNRAAIAKATE